MGPRLTAGAHFFLPRAQHAIGNGVKTGAVTLEEGRGVGHGGSQRPGKGGVKPRILPQRAGGDKREDAARGLKQKHLIRLDVIVEMEKPLEIFARLNIKHGPNVEQIVRELPRNRVGVIARDGRTWYSMRVNRCTGEVDRIERLRNYRPGFRFQFNF